MLPEHVQLLKNMWREDEVIRRPQIDRQTLEMMDHQLNDAYVHQQTVTLTLDHHGYEQSICGTIIHLDQHHQSIVLKSGENQHIVPCKRIISIRHNGSDE